MEFSHLKKIILFFDKKVLTNAFRCVIIQSSSGDARAEKDLEVITMVNELTGWSEMKSLKLSRLLVVGMFFLLVVLMFTSHIIAEWFSVISVGDGMIKTNLAAAVTAMICICDVFALIAVAALHKLLTNISKDEVFIPQNTLCLRIISWSCVFAGLTMVFFSLWKYEFLFTAFFAMFLGLIIRVVKNVLEKAVELKSEIDFTI